MNEGIYVCMYACALIYICVCVHVCVCVYECTYVCMYVCMNIIVILGIFYLQVASSAKTWGSKPTSPEEQLEGIAVKSQMSQIK